MSNVIDLKNPQPPKIEKKNLKTRNPVLSLLKESRKELQIIAPTSTPLLDSTSRTIYWEAPIFTQGKNKLALYILFILLVVGAIATYYIRKETTFSVLLGLFALVLLLNSGRKSRWMKILIDHRSITIDSDSYFFKDILSFWIDYDTIDKNLVLTMKKWYLPYLKIPLDKTNPLDVRSIMIDNIPERKVEKGFLDILIKKLGF